MKSPNFHPVRKQLADHLREGISRGRWTGTMPGRDRLARELEINPKTVEAALNLLENEGLLVSRGPGRRRKIVLPDSDSGLAVPLLRVALLVLDSPARGADYMIELRHLLEEAGHTPFFPDKTLHSLGMDVGRVAKFVNQTPADAWVVSAGSREVLEWFSAQPLPAFALFGRRRGLPIASAGPDKGPVFAAVTRHLIGLGHRRISLLCRRQRRQPQPGQPERAYLDTLEAAGIQTGEFHLPEWEESQAGFQQKLESLFRNTPPTALILDEPILYHAAFHYLARRQLRVPEDVSLVCTDHDPGFAWCRPSVAHIRWDYRPVVRRVVRWIHDVARGKDDRRQTLTKAEFIEGGTIGPAPKGR